MNGVYGISKDLKDNLKAKIFKQNYSLKDAKKANWSE